MKPNRCIIPVLALILIIAIMPAYAIDQSWEKIEPLTEDVVLTTGCFSDQNRQTEHYLTYTPGGSAMPMVWYGSTLGETAVFEEAALDIESRGKRVIAGVNGDYFVMSTGQPVGLLISEGKIITSDNNNPALGFFPDGSAFFGVPSLNMSVQIGAERFRIAGINKPIQHGDFFLYTGEFGSHTPARMNTRNLILSRNSGETLRVGAELDVYVEAIFWSDDPVEIQPDQWVLSLTSDSDNWRMVAIDALSVGDRLTLRISADDARWSECTYASGSLYKLVTDGAAVEDLDRIDASRAPRTAVGVREDGSVIFYTVDGRQDPYSAGLTLSETADRLLALGCIEAGALDGGGSTILYAQSSGESVCIPRSTPSGAREREVSTYLFLVTEGEGSGEGKTLSVRYPGETVLSGSHLALSAGVCDEKGTPISNDAFSWTASRGSISPDGVYTAPDQGGIVEITAEAQGLIGKTKLTVVDTPDTIRILSERTHREITRLSLAPGDSEDLIAEAAWGILNLTAVDEDFSWDCSGDAGTIDQSGRFTASEFGGEGTITVRAGKMSITIGVSVRTVYRCIADCEEEQAGSEGTLSWITERNMDRVRFGMNSLRVDYDLGKGDAEFPIDWNSEGKARYLYFWVYGDGTNNSILCASGGKEKHLTDLGFIGWKLVSVETCFCPVEKLIIRGSGCGTIWLDQVLLSNNPEPDLDPPQISLTVNGTEITAAITDIQDGHLPASALKLTVDGCEHLFFYDESAGVIRAELEWDGSTKRVSVTASDQCGNYQTVSQTISGISEHPFTDIDGHWSEPYVEYLYRLGVINGQTDIEDETRFDPDAPVTRAEFAVLLCRRLGLRAEEGETPVFEDAAEIPEWAEYAVRIAASRGLIKGELNNGILYFDPFGLLTRAQAATILGRTMPAGSPYADLAFPDAAEIPDWAASYVSRMTFLGIINGFEDGTFRADGTLTRAQTAKLLTEMR